MAGLCVADHWHFSLRHKVGLAVVAILFGMTLLGFSFLSMSQKISGTYASHPSFYWPGPILPDHVFYPVLMARDQLNLRFSSDNDRFNQQLELAARRMWTSQQLAFKGQKDLAVMTAAKGQKYLLAATETFNRLPASEQTQAAQSLVDALASQIKDIKLLQATLTDTNSAALTDLQAQQLLNLTKLQNQFKLPQVPL